MFIKLLKSPDESAMSACLHQNFQILDRFLSVFLTVFNISTTRIPGDIFLEIGAF